VNVAIIPARGGSKRIPRKNIREFCGKPMIAWSIEAARASGLFDRIIISTDDAEIADVGRKWGAEVPFIRSAELSSDYAGTLEVMAHATQWALDQNLDLEAVCCIYATAPFIQVTDLQNGLNAIRSGDWAYSFAATDFGVTIFRSFKKSSGGGVEMFFPEHYDKRSQDLPIALHDAGQFYWGRPEAWIKKFKVFEKHSFPVVIPRWRVQDIDTQSDWIYAEIMFKNRGSFNHEN
jgi:N-acylneuraminate cytidylyltransferase